MPNYVVGGRKFPQWSFRGDDVTYITRPQSLGTGGAPPPPATTHKRLYHNQYYFDGLNGIILWQNAGSGGGPPPGNPAIDYVIFARRKHRR